MQKTNIFVKKWLILAVTALTGAGIYSLAPVIFRGPFFKEILPVEAIFASSLVIHVDLSVLVWMLAIGGMLWSQFYEEKYSLLYKSAFYSAAIGMTFIALSPLTGSLNPLKNNYIPVLQNPVFFIGLGLFASGILLHLIITMASCLKMITQPLGYGLYVAVVITILAVICFIIGGFQAPVFDHNDPISFYEAIFWGGGHILQVSFTTLLIVAWFTLLEACGYKNPLSSRYIYMLFAINLLICLPTPFLYLSDNSTALFAAHMRNFLGISPLIAGCAVIYTVFNPFFRAKVAVNGGASMSLAESTKILTYPGIQQERQLKPFLILSILLFGYGGVLAYMISGVNVTIPAHYHGSIVGTTLAFMGIVYYFMPKVGFTMPKGLVAKAQPYVYGIGQAMHITGLAVMGGYGALRKDAASSQNIDTMLGKALFFSGGSFAILGGLMFVVVIFMSMRKR